MQPGTGSISCPNCGALVPPGSRFCGDCGKTLPVAPASNPAAVPTQYVTPPTPPTVAASAPPSMPTTPVAPPFVPVSAPPPGAFAPGGGYPSGYGQPGAPPMPPQMGQPGQKRGWLSRPAGKIVLVVLLVMIIGGGIGGFFLVRGLARHGLPDDIPLPDGANYVSSTSTNLGPHKEQQWVYTFTNMTPEQIDRFYASQLTSNGWQVIGDQVVFSVAQIDALRDTPTSQDLSILAAAESSDTKMTITLDT